MLCLQFCQEIAGDVPLKVINDGEVTALAAVQKIKAGNVMGISMGSSEGAGVSVFPNVLVFFWNRMSNHRQLRLRAKRLNHNTIKTMCVIHCYPVFCQSLVG